MPISRRNLIRSAVAVGTLAAVGRATTGTAQAAAPFKAYSGSHCFYKSAVAGLPVDSTRTTAMRNYINAASALAYPKINGLGSNPWGMPYAKAGNADPTWKLQATGGTLPAVCADLRTTGFRAPDDLGDRLTGTSDSPVVIIDTITGQTVWASAAVDLGNNILGFGTAGRFKHAGNGLDRRNTFATNANSERSRGAIPDAMVIRRDLMDWAIANSTGLGHVLHVFWEETDDADGDCHPMVGHESPKSGWGAEGERLAIAASINLTTRGLSPAGLAIARTLQQHGMYIGDNAGSGGTALKAEQTTASHTPWAGLSINQNSLSGITWDDFVVIEQGAD